MNTKPLRLLFDAMHHDKHSFEDFLTIDVSEHYERVGWRNRVIYKPSKTLRAIHSFLRNFVFDYLPTNDRVSFAYRKGITLRDAVELHAHSRAFYQTDLHKFFDSITADMVREVLLQASTPVEDLPAHLERILELTTISGRLPIGYSTSPILSNTCLKTFDDHFEETCHAREWTYSRYADDIVVSAKTFAAIDGAEQAVEAAIAETLGGTFQLNRKKSRLATVGRKVKILGMVILPSGHITIDKMVRNTVETQLHFYVSDRARLAQIFNGEVEEGLQRLSGHISHIHSADQAYLQKLRRKFGSTVVDSLLHRSAL